MFSFHIFNRNKYPCCAWHARSYSTECVRLKNFVTNAQIMDNTIKYCGVYDFAFNEGGQNGEGIYIGTSNTQVRHKNACTQV